MARVRITGRGRRRLAGGHPWIFADDLHEVEASAGDLVAIEDPAGKVLGFGFYSKASKIAVRVVAPGDAEPDAAFWRERMARALALRRRAGMLATTGACRLVAGDADGFPGFVADRYGHALVLQSGTLASDQRREQWLALLDELCEIPLTTVFDRSDSSARRLENLDPRLENLRGDPSAPCWIEEGSARFRVDLQNGQKTGAYLDQRENRARAARSAEGGLFLDAFAFEGWFGIQAALAGAERVLCLEQSRESCERVLENAQANQVADRVEVARVNCMQELRRLGEQDRRYQVVVVDPPPFARNKRELIGAARGYTELNRRAAHLTARGGLMVSASCSYHVLPEVFLEYLRAAVHLAGREAWLEQFAGPPPDHPHRLSLPETNYLKCAFLRLD